MAETIYPAVKDGRISSPQSLETVVPNLPYSLQVLQDFVQTEIDQIYESTLEEERWQYEARLAFLYETYELLNSNQG